MKRKKMHDKVILLAKSYFNSLEVLISKALNRFKYYSSGIGFNK